MTPRQRKVLLVTSASGFMVFLDATVVNVAFPSFARSFPGASLAGLSWILSGYSIVFAALLVPAGRLADVLGRRRSFLAGIVLFTAASLACALAPSVELLVAARILQALGGAILVPTSQALLMGEFEPSKRATAVGLWGAAAAVAAAAGPPIGGLLVESSDWRLVFLVNIPVGVAAWLAARGLLRESREAAAGLPDAAGAVLAVAGVAALALGIVQAPDWGWTDARVVAAFVGAPVLLIALVWRSLRHPAPVIELALFRTRSFAVANVGTLLMGIALFASLLCNVLFLTTVWGYSVLEAGLAMTPTPVAGAVFAVLGGRLADRRDPRVVVIAGALALALGAAWLIVGVGSTPAYVSEWLPGALLLGAGIGLGYATLTSVAALELPAASFGIGSGINAMARQLGAVLGVAIFVAAAGTPGPGEAAAAFDRGWAVVVVAALAAAASCLALGRLRATAPAPALPGRSSSVPGPIASTDGQGVDRRTQAAEPTPWR